MSSEQNCFDVNTTRNSLMITAYQRFLYACCECYVVFSQTGKNRIQVEE